MLDRQSITDRPTAGRPADAPIRRARPALYVAIAAALSLPVLVVTLGGVWAAALTSFMAWAWLMRRLDQTVAPPPVLSARQPRRIGRPAAQVPAGRQPPRVLPGHLLARASQQERRRWTAPAPPGAPALLTRSRRTAEEPDIPVNSSGNVMRPLVGGGDRDPCAATIR